MKYLGITCILISALWGCNTHPEQNDNGTTPAKSVTVNAPAFNADSAFAYTQAQVNFGFRVPNTKSHDDCANWLAAKMRTLADTVYVQKFEATGWDKKKLQGTNIIASFNPQATTRILLTSHWDSRPWADKDTVNTDKPFPSACDGASGVATLMEIANAIKKQPLTIGVDIFFNDLEDYGKPEFENSYCLGSQWWSRNPHVSGYKADFGILLDMAAAHNAVFAREQGSEINAGWVVEEVWNNAATLGYSNMFSNQTIGGLTDDHFYINSIAKIPTIDIIHYDPNSRSQTFGDYWHTHGDDMSVIDKGTLNAVGKTLLYTVYKYDAEQKQQ